MLFGSDYPLIAPERWVEDLRGLGIREEVLPGILKHNALGALNLV